MYQFLVLFISLDNKWVQPYFGWFVCYMINCKKNKKNQDMRCFISTRQADPNPEFVYLPIFWTF